MAQVRTGWLVARLARCQDAAGEEDIRRALVLANLARAERIARRYRHRGASLKRLRLVAFDALVEATRSFDPGVGTDFQAYTGALVRGAVRREVPEPDPTGRPAGPLEVAVDAEVGDRLGRDQAHDVLARVVPCLAPRDRLILELRFFEEMSEDEIAGRLELRPVQVSRATRRILQQLRVAQGRPLRLAGAADAGGER